MLTGALHALGVIELFDRIKKLFETENVVEGGEALYKRLSGRFAEAARTEFWPWAQTDFKHRNPAGYAVLFRRQRERHEWQTSGGRFNRLAEEYMNEAFGRVFRKELNPERRFIIFGEVASMSEEDFAAWLDAVTEDGFERYILFAADTVMERVWPRLTEAEYAARRALRWAMGFALAFYLVFALGEVTGNNAIHGFLALALLGAVAVAWWNWATVALAASAIQQTRSVTEVVAAGFASATLMLVVGILVPFHLAPRELELASLIALPGLAFVAYWGFMKGVSTPFMSPRTVGFALSGVIIASALLAVNNANAGAIGNAVSPVYERVKDVMSEPFASSASVAEVEEVAPSMAYPHPVQSVCTSPMVWDAGRTTLPARHDCWSGVVVVPATATTYMPSAAGNCWEMFFPNPAGDTRVAGEAGFLQKCTDPPQHQRGVFRVRTLAPLPPGVNLEVSYR